MQRETRTSSAIPSRSSSREVILRAAATCFAKDGYARTRVFVIAREAGVSRANLYKHFPSKRELLLALNEYMIDDWRCWLEESVAAAATAREAIELWLREGLADSWRVTAAQVVISDEAEEDLAMDRGATRDALRATQLTLSRVLKRGVSSGELRADLDVAATARGLQAILLGLLRSQLAERPIVRLERRAELTAVIDLVVHGLLRT